MRASRAPSSSPYSECAAAEKSSRQDLAASASRRSTSPSSKSAMSSPGLGRITKCRRASIDSLTRAVYSRESPCSCRLRISAIRSRTAVV